MAKYLRTLAMWIAIASLLELSSADIQLFVPNSSVANSTSSFFFPDSEALFGKHVYDPIRGVLAVASPANACSPVQDKRNLPGYNNSTLWFLLVETYHECEYSLKVLYGQLAGFDAVIVRNMVDNERSHMASGHYGDSVTVPSVFVGQDVGNILAASNYTTGSFVIITSNYDFNFFVIPVVIVVAVLMVCLMLLLVAKYVHKKIKQRKLRLPASDLNKIPTHVFKKGDAYDSCPICLDDYVEGEKLRILPCHHVYHCICVDEWLTAGKRWCPVCKFRVCPESASDGADESPAIIFGEDDTAPLLGRPSDEQPPANSEAV